MKDTLVLVTVTLAIALAGCEKSQEKQAPKVETRQTSSQPPGAAKSTAHKEEPGHEGHDHAAPAGKPGHSGEIIELGTAKIGAFTVRTSRDKGDIKPGGDSPIDVWIDGGVGTGVSAVRFWIGNQDAKGSIKAKAGVEEGKWHAHVEIPNPVPEGASLWVEVEELGGKKTSESFKLTP